MKWLLYRAFARLVYHPRDSALFTAMRDYVDLRTLDERLHMMDEIMGDQPGHWGRFAMWIVWTSGWYPDRQAYQYFQEIQEHMPECIPSLKSFICHCVVARLLLAWEGMRVTVV